MRDRTPPIPDLARFQSLREADRRERLSAAIRVLGQIEGLDRMIYIEMLAAHFEEEMLMDVAQRVPVVDEERYQPTAREQTSLMWTRAHRAGCEQGYQQGRQDGREEGREEGVRAGEQEGRLATQARLLLALLEQRGLAIPRRVRMRVLECGDSAQLDRWFLRAVHIERADALLLEE